MDLASISRAVAAEFGTDAARLTQHGHRAGPAKAVALALACRLTDPDQREIGGYYGWITSMALCTARRRLQQDLPLHEPGHAQPDRGDRSRIGVGRSAEKVHI